jgi:hypothetical protein
MSELSKKRVRTSLKAIAHFKRACILSSSLSERCNQVVGGQYKVKNLPKEPMSHYWKQDTWTISILFPTSQWSQNVCWVTAGGTRTYGISTPPALHIGGQTGGGGGGGEE